MTIGDQETHSDFRRNPKARQRFIYRFVGFPFLCFHWQPMRAIRLILQHHGIAQADLAATPVLHSPGKPVTERLSAEMLV